jgi:hypothetical protein
MYVFLHQKKIISSGKFPYPVPVLCPTKHTFYPALSLSVLAETIYFRPKMKEKKTNKMNNLG